MRVTIICIICIFCHTSIAGQNLIPNPGFDTITECPYDVDQVHFAYPWTSFGDPSDQSGNLYNTCQSNNLGYNSIPNVGFRIDSYQHQRSGSGFAGINNFWDADDLPNDFLITPLSSALIQERQYYVEFYVNVDLTPTDFVFDLFSYTDGIGLSFSESFYSTANFEKTFDLIPAASSEGTLLTDTLNWTRINGCYIANGQEKYAIIGNFRPDSETEAVHGNPDLMPHSSFLFIEDVLVQEFNPLPDTLLICDGKSSVLNTTFLDATYLWNTGETDAVIWVSESGIYSIEATISSCVLRDTVIVINTEEVVNWSSDTLICEDEVLTLIPILPGNYEWSNGSMATQLTIQASGNYVVTITNECGEFSYSTNVETAECTCDIFVPNAISPNNDGINDELEIFVDCNFEYQPLSFSVFDRWGNTIFSSTKEEQINWDGTFNGRPLQSGVYIWVLTYEIIQNGVPEKKIKKGDVAILK